MLTNRARLFFVMIPLALTALPVQAQTTADYNKQIATLQAQYKQTATENEQAGAQYKQNYQDLVKVRAQHQQTGFQIASAGKTVKTPADKANLQKLHMQYNSESDQLKQIWATRRSLIEKQKTLSAQHTQQLADLKKLYAEKSAAKR